MSGAARDLARPPDTPVHAAPLWALARGPYLARCDLRGRSRSWELHVFIDDQLLLSRRCLTPVEAGAVSSGWRTRLTAAGWSQPGPATALDRQA
jgi:hypothetical protein